MSFLDFEAWGTEGDGFHLRVMIQSRGFRRIAVQCGECWLPGTPWSPSWCSFHQCLQGLQTCCVPSTYHGSLLHLSDGAMCGDNKGSEGQVSLSRRNGETGLHRSPGGESSPLCRVEFSSYFGFIMKLTPTMTSPVTIWGLGLQHSVAKTLIIRTHPHSSQFSSHRAEKEEPGFCSLKHLLKKATHRPNLGPLFETFVYFLAQLVIQCLSDLPEPMSMN